MNVPHIWNHIKFSLNMQKIPMHVKLTHQMLSWHIMGSQYPTELYNVLNLMTNFFLDAFQTEESKIFMQK